MAHMNINTQDLDKYSRDVNYSAEKNDLVNNARKQKAPDNLTRNLDRLPDKRYSSPKDVRTNIDLIPKYSIE